MSQESAPAHPPSTLSWEDSLATFLLREEGLEALRVDPRQRKISLATLGPVDLEAIQERLEGLLATLDEPGWTPSPVSSAKPAPAGFGLRVSHPKVDEMLLEKPSCDTAPKLWTWREFIWPEADELENQSRAEWVALAWQAGICGMALATGWTLSRFGIGPPWLAIQFFTVSLIAGGWDAAKDTWEKLRQGQVDVHFLMLAVALGAVSIGAWLEGGLLLFLFSLSGALEHFALHRTHREISALTKAAPKTARMLHADGREEVVPVVLLRPGDQLRVLPDEAFAVDADILEGESAADESNLTGEARPVPKRAGDPVYGGTLNLWGKVRVLVTRVAAESSLQKIVRMIRDAQHLRAPSQRFTDRFGTPYTLGILGLSLIMFFVWWLGFDIPPFRSTAEGHSAFYRTMTLLVVASPCALVLSIPSAILAAIACGARRGVLFRGGAAVENLALADAVALDKTGTLTRGELKVGSVESFPPGRERDVLEIALTLEQHSNHPIARAIVAHAAAEGVVAQDVDDFRSVTGQGLKGRIGAELSYLGRRELIERGEMGEWIRQVPDPPLEYTEVWVVRRDVVGRLLLRDEVREQSGPVMERLKKDGVYTIMLTGDRRGAAEQVAKRLGVAEVRAGLHPEEKVSAIQELTASGHRVAMVGDGVNDAPSLAAAFVSVAMGGKGSDAALEQSDVVLMDDRIEKLLTARAISKRARSIIRQNLTISLGTVVLMIGASLFGLVPLTIGVLAHEGSTVVVCLNSLRLLFLKEEKVAPE